MLKCVISLIQNLTWYDSICDIVHDTMVHTKTVFVYVYRIFDTFNMTNKLLKCNLMYLNIFLFLLTPLTLAISYTFHMKLQCCMQHAPLTPLTYPRSCKTWFFYIPVFGRKVSLIFLIIYQLSDLWSHLHISQSDPIKPLIFAEKTLDDTITLVLTSLVVKFKFFQFSV